MKNIRSLSVRLSISVSKILWAFRRFTSHKIRNWTIIPLALGTCHWHLNKPQFCFAVEILWILAYFSSTYRLNIFKRLGLFWFRHRGPHFSGTITHFLVSLRTKQVSRGLQALLHRFTSEKVADRAGWQEYTLVRHCPCFQDNKNPSLSQSGFLCA